MQIRYADLEINESDLIRNVTNKISNNNNEKSNNDSKITDDNNNNNSSNNNNFDIIFNNLNMNSIKGIDKICDDMKFDSCYVNPEPICSSSTDHITVPGCKIVPGTELIFQIQYNTIQYNTIQYNTIQYNTIQYNTIQYNTIQYITI